MPIAAAIIISRLSPISSDFNGFAPKVFVVMMFAPASRYSVCIFSIKAAFVRFKSSGISPAPIPFFCSIEPIPPSKNSILLPSNSLTFIIYILSYKFRIKRVLQNAIPFRL